MPSDVLKALHSIGQAADCFDDRRSLPIEPLSHDAFQVTVVVARCSAILVDIAKSAHRVGIDAGRSCYGLTTGKRDTAAASVASYNAILVVGAVTDNAAFGRSGYTGRTGIRAVGFDTDVCSDVRLAARRPGQRCGGL